ncbi:acetyl-CoA carboxylase biotin carboxyl carrier protein [Fodinicurvata sp. EGI_FJ10296]|uniref:acetyl-CoA carboxylase biotin carboxyl carrier protein n=1 Tax=Fodinicurvata sp. EGI_FJ10296 TaxID=3231908 RepID=UPI00345113B9
MTQFNIDGDMIRTLAEILKESGLTEIEYAEGESRIRVARHVQIQATPAVPELAAAPAEPPKAETPAGPPAGAVTSPIVGTAYLASEPGAKPFVSVGDAVKAGQTVLIVEAMKVMNPIRAPKAGTVREIFVSDAQPVEFGEPLLAIE